VDEAYLPFAAGLRSIAGLEMGNIISLRSMTKDYALAGLRLGYLVADEAVIDALVRVRPPWNVNTMAQAAGIAALEEEAYLGRCVERLRDTKRSLVDGMRTLGLEPLPSRTHFFLVPVGDAAACRSALLARGIQVRDCTSFGLPAYVRIAARRPQENAELLQAFREVTI
jgi:histidinol-phosphate aminotransferase